MRWTASVLRKAAKQVRLQTGQKQIRPRQATSTTVCTDFPPLLFQVRPTRRSWPRALDEQENVANARLDFECMPSSLTHLSLRVVAHVNRQREDLEISLQGQRFELQKPCSFSMLR